MGGVDRVVVAHNCGLVINPDGLKNQIEGNVIQSLSRTLLEEVTFDRHAGVVAIHPGNTAAVGGLVAGISLGAGRQALLDLAAEHFKVPANQLTAKEGTISVLGSPSRTITYGKLVEGKRLNIEIGASGERFAMKVAPKARTKDPSTYTVVGRSMARKDIPDKVMGRFTYVQDVRVDGMLHGRVVRPYGVEATLESVDETGLENIPGFVQVVRQHNFLA